MGEYSAAAVPAKFQETFLKNARSDAVAAITWDGSTELFNYFCCASGGFLFALPCFWFHGVFMGPCILMSAMAQTDQTKKKALVLTQREVLMVQLDADGGCCGAMTTGVQVKTVPLEQVTDVTTDRKGRGCLQKTCVPDIQLVGIDNASGSAGQQEILIMGVDKDEADKFKRAVFDQRDVVLGRAPGNAAPAGGAPQMQMVGKTMMPVPQQQTMAAGGGGGGGVVVVERAAADKLRDLHKLKNEGLITEDEFGTIRAKILANF